MYLRDKHKQLIEKLEPFENHPHMLAVQNLSRLALKQKVMFRTLDDQNHVKLLISYRSIKIHNNTAEIISERTVLHFERIFKI